MEGRHNCCVDTWTSPGNLGRLWVEINKGCGGVEPVYVLVKSMTDGWDEHKGG